MNHSHRIATLGLLLASVTAAPLRAEPMRLALMEGSEPVRLRVQPSADSNFVARANPGEVFELLATEREWMQVRGFHDSYFVLATEASELFKTLELPSEATRKALFSALLAAENRAGRTLAPVVASLQEKSVEQVASFFAWLQNLGPFLQSQPAGMDGAFLELVVHEQSKLQVCRGERLVPPLCVAVVLEGGEKAW